ncbi:MAG: hypothetical protein AAFY29_04335 [Pseudomonadota bacterium]
MSSCGGPPAVSLGPGVKAAAPPEQRSISGETLHRGATQLTPRAEFTVQAKLLSKRRYRWDELAVVSSWDFAVGWGAISDETVTAGTRVLQGDRLMYWHLYDAPLPLSIVERSSANIHLIGETDEITRQFEEAPLGSIVTLKGRLVDVRLPDNRVVPTSLTRLDRGVGACEILFVSEIDWSTDA